MADNFLKLVTNPLRFRFFLLAKLPAAFFSGVKIVSVSNDSCGVTVPYKWFSQNPFKSTYFACLAMAAEMSTGILAMMHTYKKSPAVSMLVTGLEAQYFKKAVGVTTFTCNSGDAIYAAIQQAIETGQGTVVRAESVGKNAAGEKIATFYITWSFKVKNSKE